MPINSRNKGGVGEREFRDVLTAKGFTARRGQQYCGANGDPDVVCEELPHIHFEVKRTQNLNITDALQKAKSDAGEGKTPVVMWRKNYGKWMAILEADAYLDMVVENLKLQSMCEQCREIQKRTDVVNAHINRGEFVQGRLPELLKYAESEYEKILGAHRKEFKLDGEKL